MCDLVIQMLWFFVTALLQVAIYSYTKFQVNILNTFEDTLLSKFDSENTKGEIIQNLRQTELWFLVIALLQVAIYLYSKFQVNMLNSFEDTLQTKIYCKNTKGEISLSPKLGQCEGQNGVR